MLLNWALVTSLWRFGGFFLCGSIAACVISRTPHALDSPQQASQVILKSGCSMKKLFGHHTMSVLSKQHAAAVRALTLETQSAQF
jgi:hypothetical protein